MRRGQEKAGGTYGLRLLQHCQDEDDIFLPGLQGSVFEVVVVFHVPQDEVGGEGAKTGSDVGLGEVQLSGVAQTSASEPGNVLNQLEEEKEHCERFRNIMGGGERRLKPCSSDWPHLSYSEHGARTPKPIETVPATLTSSRSISSGLPKGLRNCPPRDFLRGTTTM